MDEKTETLRDVFLEVSDTETVTESQAESRGSLTDETNTEQRLGELIEEMRDRYEFQTDLGNDQLANLARQFYDGESDETIAAELDTTTTTVFDARMDIHLFREGDLALADRLVGFRKAVMDETPVTELREQFDASATAIQRCQQAVIARDEARRANDRYRDEFAEILADADLTGELTDSATKDGLEGATEGMETDVSF